MCEWSELLGAHARVYSHIIAPHVAWQAIAYRMPRPPKRQPDDGQCEHYEPVQPAEPRNEADQCDEQCHKADALHDVHGHRRKRGLKVVQCFMAQLVSWLVPRV